MTTPDAWYALISGEKRDLDLFKRDFEPAGCQFDQIDERFAFTEANLQSVAKGDYESAIATAADVIDRLNTTLHLSHSNFEGLTFHTVVEQRDGKLHRVLRAEGAHYDIDTFPVATIKGGTPRPPVRSRQLRLHTLIMRNPDVHDIMRALTVKPVTWAALAAAYETIVGSLSPRQNRSDYQNLINKGWMTADDSANFYHTAAFHRHGFPKEPNRAQIPMAHEDAVMFIMDLLWKFVDEKQPI